MSADDDDARRRERARDVGLFRYSLVREAADPALSVRARGRLVRQIAERVHVGPFGEKVRVSRPTLDRWIRAWRDGGFDALVPGPRQVTPRTPDEVLELAAGLKRENPQRTAAQVERILRRHSGWSPSPRTLQRHFVRLGLNGHGKQEPADTFGRFEASRPNELWQGDALHGPVIGGRKTFLFAFCDDYSRLLTGYRFGYAEDTVRLAAALRKGLAARGVPERIYVDNGSAYVDSWLQRACAVLGVKLTHSTPGRPEGRGKIERLFRSVREQFLVEVTGDADDVGRRHVADLVELNRLFTAWVEQLYHRRVHSETGATPLDRFLDAASCELPTPQLLGEAFRWELHRVVDKTGLVKLHDNRYETDPALAGRKVELVFDPFDLTRVEVRYRAISYGFAVPHRIRRHSHPKARPEPDTDNTGTEEPVRPSGIDYAGLIAADHDQALTVGISYAALNDDFVNDTASTPLTAAGDSEDTGDEDEQKGQPA